jgi:anti-sigma regulatory factor (Ser/Thr protein kinase)
MSEGAANVVTKEFEPAPETVREARAFVRVALDGAGADWADDAMLLTSELATNAVIHARTSYSVSVSVVDDRVRVEVADGSASSARRCHYSATSGTGRGLGMIEDTAAAWGVEPRPPAGKVIWFELRAPADDERGSRPDEGAEGDDGPVDLDALLAELGGDEAGDGGVANLRRAA